MSIRNLSFSLLFTRLQQLFYHIFYFKPSHSVIVAVRRCLWQSINRVFLKNFSNSICITEILSYNLLKTCRIGLPISSCSNDCCSHMHSSLKFIIPSSAAAMQPTQRILFIFYSKPFLRKRTIGKERKFHL